MGKSVSVRGRTGKFKEKLLVLGRDALVRTNRRVTAIMSVRLPVHSSPQDHKPLFSACCTSLMEQASSCSSCSSSVWCIITQLFSIIMLWSWSGCWHLSSFSTLVLKLPFLKIFPFTAIYPLLSLISWNLITRCLAVTGGCSVGECSRLRQPCWLLGTLYLYLFTYVGLQKQQA